MRWMWGAVVVAVGCLLGTSTVGTAAAEPGGSEVPGTALTPDRFGVVAGAADAPVRLELFCDPQCPDCAKFEATSGAGIGRYLAGGQLAVTYRWLTFLDDRRHNDTSARVGSALMQAAEPAIPASAYQAFVADLYRHQAPRGSDSGDPSPEQIAALARESGVPGETVDRMVSGEPRIDTVAMNAVNRSLLAQANPENPGTPTVYDLGTNSVVDIDDAGWLDRLVRASQR